jgi:(p)ppGpp synthase/HD superfamily hydrolase
MEDPNDLMERAHAFCISAHAGQQRKDGAPYHTHPQAVAELLRSYGVDDAEVLAAAYLHDVLEDTPVSRDELVERFGEPVTRLVEELTSPDYPGRTFEQKHRELAEEARGLSDRAKMIKLADRMHNLYTMRVWPADRQFRYAQATRDLLDALKPWPLPELGRRIEERIAPYLEEASDPEHPDD